MEPSSHHWLTLHRVRFPSEISALERKFEAPSLPECWRFCPTSHLGDNDLPTMTSDSWCGFGIYDNRDDAQAMVSAPEEHIPFLSETVEQWHALLVPFSHHGQVNWRGTVQDGSAIRIASNAPAGPLAVITTAGFNSSDPDQLPRIKRLARGAQDVVDFYATADGRRQRAAGRIHRRI